MDLKAYEKRRVRELHRRITRTSTAEDATERNRTFTPDQESIRKRFYCYYLLDTLDRFYLRDLLFSGTQTAGTSKRVSVTSVSRNRWTGRATRKFISWGTTARAIAREWSWWAKWREEDCDFLRENANHLDSLEGTGFTGWQVDLYEYKGTYYVFHEAGVDEYDTYREPRSRSANTVSTAQFRFILLIRGEHIDASGATWEERVHPHIRGEHLNPKPRPGVFQFIPTHVGNTKLQRRLKSTALQFGVGGMIPSSLPSGINFCLHSWGTNAFFTKTSTRSTEALRGCLRLENEMVRLRASLSVLEKVESLSVGSTDAEEIQRDRIQAMKIRRMCEI